MIPTDPEALDAMAAEHVLGTLDAREAEAVRQALPSHKALREAVAGWEARLAPLQVLPVPEAPPAALWGRIEASLAAAGAVEAPRGVSGVLPADRPAGPLSNRRAHRGMGAKEWLWRSWAIGASAVAAGLAAFLVLRPAETPRLMTVLLTSRDQPAWLVETEGGGLRLAGINATPTEAGQVRQLWALPPGATVPVSLGLLPAGGQISVAPGLVRPEPGMLIEISLEPAGGSPTGRPSGPVQFIGRLAPARGS
ncbi:anti-sigma factor [Roseomonas mucosa]